MNLQSTSNLDYSYSPTTLKSVMPDNDCINTHYVNKPRNIQNINKKGNNRDN